MAPGGAILSFGSLVLDDVVITGNKASQGGGLAAFTSQTGDSLTITNSTLSSNEAFSSFGGSQGGGIYVSGPSVSISDTDIVNNTADGSGGGISLQNYDGGATLERLTISGNEVEVQSEFSTSRGGGVNVQAFGDDDLDIRDTVIFNNKSLGGPNDAEGIGGGVAIDGSGVVTITNTTLSGNEAVSAGGGLWKQSSNTSSLLLEGVTVTENTAALGGGVAGGATTRLRNTIVAGNIDFGAVANNIEGDINPFSAFNLLAVGGAGGLTDLVRVRRMGGSVGVMLVSLVGLPPTGSPITSRRLEMGASTPSYLEALFVGCISAEAILGHAEPASAPVTSAG